MEKPISEEGENAIWPPKTDTSEGHSMLYRGRNCSLNNYTLILPPQAPLSGPVFLTLPHIKRKLESHYPPSVSLGMGMVN